MDRLAALFRAEWVAYWRRLFRGGNAAKNNLFFMAVVALLLAGKYLSFLDHASGRPVAYLCAAAFLALATSLRNDGPLSSEGLLRFPLDAFERFAVRIFSACFPPWSWLVLLFALGIFNPLSRIHPWGIAAGVGVILAGICASQIPLPTYQRRPRSGRMTLLRKEIRYILALPEHVFILLITLAFCLYLTGGQNLQNDAFFAVLGILSVVGGTSAMGAFALDGPGGLDRYGLSPVTGEQIIRTKNGAFLAVAAAQRVPIFALSLWRLGLALTFYGILEAASLALLTLAWGNIISVRHPAPPGSEPMILDGILGFAASALPAAGAIGIMRTNPRFAPVEMVGVLAICLVLWFISLTYAGSYFGRNFQRIRSLVAG